MNISKKDIDQINSDITISVSKEDEGKIEIENERMRS